MLATIIAFFDLLRGECFEFAMYPFNDLLPVELGLPAPERIDSDPLVPVSITSWSGRSDISVILNETCDTITL